MEFDSLASLILQDLIVIPSNFIVYHFSFYIVI